MTTLLARMARRVTLEHVQHVCPVAPRAAGGLVGQIYRQVERDFGMLAPPVALHSPAPAVLAACWAMLRETLLVPGRATRTAKEAVAAAVSLANRCPYCVDVHGAALTGLLRDGDARAVVADRLDAVRDPRLRALAVWARASAAPAGTHAPATPPAGADRSVTPAGADLIGVAVTFHYLNRMVNVFLRESPLPDMPAGARRVATAVAAGLARRLAGNRPVPGDALPLLPDAPLPADLSWAADEPRIASAMARAAAAIDAAAAEALPLPVRQVVLSRLAETPGLHGRAWSDAAVAPLPPRQRPVARLALLTATASYQVGPQLIAEFRQHRPDDAALVAVTAWASLAAARRVGERLHHKTRPA